MNGDILTSRFWRWHLAQKPADDHQSQTKQQEALEILVESINAGEILSLDGVNTPLSAAIKIHHQLADFEMNSHWIGSAQDWVCPCCLRSKFQIARIGNKGQILAKLVVHHDHMGDALKTAFYAALESSGTTVEQNEGQRLVERIGGAFSAYEEVLVCEDCNNADTEAKKRVAAPQYFSFSIRQIRRFIRSSDHQTHQVDGITTKEMWLEAKPAYDLRMQVIRTVAHAAATDTHWYEPYARGVQAVPVLGYGRHHRDSSLILKWVSATALFEALGPQEKKAPRNMSRWRTVVQPPGRSLPSNFLAMLRTEEAFARKWDGVSEDWICPICKRSKEHVVYVGDKGKVSFILRTTPGRDEWARSTTICNHCSSIQMSLKWEVAAETGAEIRDSYKLVTPYELASIIEARPHSPHLIRQNEAKILVETIVQHFGFSSGA